MAILTNIHQPVGPRVWRAGDPEPGRDVQAVMTRSGYVGTRYPHGGWLTPGDEPGGSEPWSILLLWDGPLVEVTLPEPVAE